MHIVPCDYTELNGTRRRALKNCTYLKQVMYFLSFLEGTGPTALHYARLIHTENVI